MEMKTGREIYFEGLDVIEANKESGYDNKTTKARSKHHKREWVALDEEVKEALSFYYHLKNHTEVQQAPTYRDMPVCKICNKPAYQIMCEEWESLSTSQSEGTELRLESHSQSCGCSQDQS